MLFMVSVPSVLSHSATSFHMLCLSVSVTSGMLVLLEKKLLIKEERSREI